MAMILHLGIFALSVYLDFAFAKWTRSVVAGHTRSAMAWSGSYYAISMLATLIFVGNPWTIPAAVAGHSIGTWLCLKGNR